MKTLQRYVAKELFFPFVMAVTVFTFLLVMDKIFTLSDLIVKYGVSVLTVGHLLLLLLPATFAITIPMGCLVAAMVAFSRLKGDNEITAIKASGISLLPLVGMALALGGALTILMIWFNNVVLPDANLGYRDLYFNIVRQRASIVIQEHVFVEDFDGYVFRVGDKDPLTGRLRNVVVFVQERKPSDPVRTIVAQTGRLISDAVSRKVMLQLHDGFMQIVQKTDRNAFSQIHFDTLVLDLDINRALLDQDAQTRRTAREMSMGDILRKIHSDTPQENLNLLWVEYFKKTSIPFACFAFILIGSPLGILAPRSGRYFAYFIGVLLIFLYYIFISLGETFGVDGRLNPFLAMWLPNLLLTGAGAYGLAWVLGEHPPLWPRRRLRP